VAACICLRVWKATNPGPNITQHQSDITLYCARFTQGKPQSTLTIVTRDTCLRMRKFGAFFFMSVHICLIERAQMIQCESELMNPTPGNVSERSSHSLRAGRSLSRLFHTYSVCSAYPVCIFFPYPC